MEQNLNRAVESMVSAKPDYTGEIIAIIRSPISPSVMRERLEDYHEKDIAEVLPALTSAERKKLYRILEPDMLSNILERVEGAEANTYLIEMQGSPGGGAHGVRLRPGDPLPSGPGAEKQSHRVHG